MFFRLVVLVCFLLMPVAASAEEGAPATEEQVQEQLKEPLKEKPPEMQLNLPPAILKGEADYTAAMVRLKEDQKAQLKVVEQAFFLSMVPVMESYDLAGKLIFCMGTVQQGSAISVEQDRYSRAFASYRDSKAAEQAKLWREQSAVTLSAITYIDQNLIGKHLDYIETVQKTYAEQMIVKAGRAGVYKKTDCKAVQTALEQAETASPGEGTSTPPKASVQENDASSLIPPDSIISDDGSSGMLGVTPP